MGCLGNKWPRCLKGFGKLPKRVLGNCLKVIHPSPINRAFPSMHKHIGSIQARVGDTPEIKSSKTPSNSKAQASLLRLYRRRFWSNFPFFDYIKKGFCSSIPSSIISKKVLFKLPFFDYIEEGLVQASLLQLHWRRFWFKLPFFYIEEGIRSSFPFFY